MPAANISSSWSLDNIPLSLHCPFTVTHASRLIYVGSPSIPTPSVSYIVLPSEPQETLPSELYQVSCTHLKGELALEFLVSQPLCFPSGSLTLLPAAATLLLTSPPL